MLWLVLSVLTALSESFKDVFSKRGIQHTDEYIVAWSLRLFAFIFLLPAFFFIEIPEIGPNYWTALFFGSTLNVATTLLYMKALKESDLSLSVPFITFTPLFLLLTSPIIVGEFPSFIGILGVVLIVIGSYTMNIRNVDEGWLAPFKSLFREKGPRYMLAVAFIWSITSNVDKVGVQNSSPLFWAITVTAAIAAMLGPIAWYLSDDVRSRMTKDLPKLAPIGLFSALTLTFQMSALNLTLVAYVISIKRTSAVLAVVWGMLFFGESDIRQRFIGASIMLAGLVLITLTGSAP